MKVSTIVIATVPLVAWVIICLCWLIAVGDA